MDFRVTEKTPVFDRTTGARIPYAEYQRLISPDPRKYFVEPRYDEYGKVGSFVMREATPEERQSGMFRGRNPDDQPKVGQPLPPFIVEAADGNRYRSADLKGKVVVLSFWFSLKKPLYNENQGQRFAEALALFRQKTEVVSLGFSTRTEDLEEALLAPASPFVPVSDSNGFVRRYGITTMPSFVVIDPAGNVAGFVEGFSDASRDALKTTLGKLIP